MKFEETILPGVFVITLEPIEDPRGFFARCFCKKEFLAKGIEFDVCQNNISHNKKIGTLRGLHYHHEPYQERKLVMCSRGAIFDVIVDIRKDSHTFGQSIHVELSAENYKMIYIPKGFAHGFQTLRDDCDVFYMMGDYYVPNVAAGFLWNSSAINIPWPITNTIISDQDRQLPEFIL